MAAVGGATWRHLHGVEARSDEWRRGDAWGEGRRRHAYGTRKNRRLERTHTNHWLLHWRNLRAFKGFTVDVKLLYFPVKHMSLVTSNDYNRRYSEWYFNNIFFYNSNELFTCAGGGAAAAATGKACVSSGCCGSERPLCVSSSRRPRVFLAPTHSEKKDTIQTG